MGDSHEFEQQARPLALQAAVFRCLREHGLEPQLSDTLGRRVAPAVTFPEQMVRISLGAEVAGELHHGLGLYLGDDERRWIRCVVDAACERFERRQRRQQRPVERPAPRPMIATSTASTTVVVFRKRDGGHHG
jgi:hypothetical protein